MKTALLWLLLTIGLQGQTIVWEKVDFINWFDLRDYSEADSMRIVTNDSCLYVYNDNDNIWTLSGLFNGERVANIFTGERYEFYTPQNVLREIPSGRIQSIPDVMQKEKEVYASFKGDTVLLANIERVVLYDIHRDLVISDFAPANFLGSIANAYLTNDYIVIATDILVHIYEYDGNNYDIMYLMDAGSNNSFQEISQIFNNIIINGDNGVIMLDLKTRDSYYIIKKDDKEGSIMSYFVDMPYVYTATYIAYDSTIIEATNVKTKKSEYICCLPSYGGTGRMSCRILKADGTNIIVSDFTGGIFIYYINARELNWFGYGIYKEVPVSYACANSRHILYYARSGMYVCEDGKCRRAKNTLIYSDLWRQIGIYKDSVVTSVLGDVEIWAVDDKRGHKIVIPQVHSYAVTDSVIYAATKDMVLSYGGIIKYLFDANNADIVLSGNVLYAYDEDGTMKYYDRLNRECDSIELPQYATWKIEAADSELQTVVLSNGSNILSYDYSEGGVKWEKMIYGNVKKNLLWRGENILVTEKGEIINVADGEVMNRVKVGVIDAVVYRDTCFLFYSNGEVMRGIYDVQVGMRQQKESYNRGEIEIYPNPARLKINVLYEGELESRKIEIVGMDGETYYKKDALCCGAKVDIDVPLLGDGAYILLVITCDGVIEACKKFIVY